MHFFCIVHRKLRLGALSTVHGGRPESNAIRGTSSHYLQPADPTDPGNAADLDTPQGLEIALVVGPSRNDRCALIANTSRGCASSNSLGLENSTNLVVNLTHYGYGDRHCRRKRAAETEASRHGFWKIVGLPWLCWALGGNGLPLAFYAARTRSVFGADDLLDQLDDATPE